MPIFDSSGCAERASVSNSGSISRTRSTMRTRRFVVVRINELVARIITAGVTIAERTPSVESRLGRENITPEPRFDTRSEEHTSELQSLAYTVCRLLLDKKKLMS